CRYCLVKSISSTSLTSAFSEYAGNFQLTLRASNFDMSDLYDNPLIGRYASREMCELWGPSRKFRTWRELWVMLAEAEAELGLPIKPSQIEQLRKNVANIDFAKADEYERKFRHD